jgi:hypothetical protein
MQLKHKRPSSSDNNERSKRCKLNEERYDASIARETLKKSGKQVRPIETERSRIALGKVDMSRVKLVRSKDVESSPFLIPASQPFTQINYDFATESVYNTLVESCRRAYELLDAVDTESESTSSFSDTDSDDSQGCSKEMIAIKPRIDDVAPIVAQPAISASVAEPEVSTLPAVTMAMEEALTVCNFSRLMTLATAPYTVVHYNAACGRLTGLSSASMLGKPLFNSLGNPESISLASCAESSAGGKHVPFSVVGKDKKTIECLMKVTPIVSSVQSAPKVTHYAVDFTVMGDGTNASLQQVAEESANSRQALATTVVG